jgi:hypothetical protein
MRVPKRRSQQPWRDLEDEEPETLHAVVTPEPETLHAVVTPEPDTGFDRIIREVESIVGTTPALPRGEPPWPIP